MPPLPFRRDSSTVFCSAAVLFELEAGAALKKHQALRP